MTYEQLRVTRTSSALWRVAFDAPPINLIGPQLVVELRELLVELETDPLVSVVVFESAVDDYFLAHWDIAADPEAVSGLPAGPTGYHPWLDILIRLSKVPVITVSSIRGRARGAGSEFLLATDIRFASREKAVLGQFEVGTGAVPGGGTPSRLPRLIGRGRALEVLVSAGDYDGDLAERYGYVNRALPDDELDGFVTAFAERVSRFDLRALQEVKAFVNQVSLPADEEFPPQMEAFWKSAGRPETQNRAGQLFARGLQGPSEVELDLGAALGELQNPRTTTPRLPRRAVTQTRTFDPPAAGVCPFVRAVGMVQETWTFLILREAVTTAAATREEFAGIPGLTPRVLSSRLDSLVRAGVFVARRDGDRSARYEMTDAGMQLVVILRALGDWADRFAPGAPPVEPAI